MICAIPPPLPRATVRDALEQKLMACHSRQQALQIIEAPELQRVIPGLNRLRECDQGRFFHLEGDVAVHTAMVLEQVVKLTPTILNRPATFIERLAALLHDIKKPDTRVESAEGRVSFPQHEREGAKLVATLQPTLRLSDDELAGLVYLVGLHGVAHDWATVESYRKAQVARSEFFDSLSVLQEADANSCLRPDGVLSPRWGDVMREERSRLLAAVDDGKLG